MSQSHPNARYQRVSTCANVAGMAQKISEVREELAELQEAYSEALTDLGRVIDTARKQHDRAHDGVLRFCPVEVCKLVVELDDSWSGELS